MSKRFLFWWSVWIGVVSGIYCFIYQLLPLPTKNLMWMTFVALPIYFNAGAKREEFFNYFFSMLAGVVWALIYLYFIGLFTKAKVSVPITLGVVVGIVTIVCCALHFCITGKTWLNKLPMMFGAIAVTFSQNGQNLLTVIITLAGGLLLGLCCSEGTRVLEKLGIMPTDEKEGKSKIVEAN